MSLRIHTNLASLTAQHQVKKTEQKLEATLRQMASGQRLHPQDEGKAAEKSLATILHAQEKGLKAGSQNLNHIISFTDIAEAGLNEQSNILIRLKELAIQSASSNLDEKARELLQLEFTQLIQELDRIAHATQMGSKKLLASNQTKFNVQLGPGPEEHHRIQVNLTANTTVKNLNLDNISIETAKEAQSALSQINEAHQIIARARAEFGSFATRLNIAHDHLETQRENIIKAHSHIADANIAEITSDFYKLRALQQYQILSLTEANQKPLNFVKLIA